MNNFLLLKSKFAFWLPFIFLCAAGNLYALGGGEKGNAGAQGASLRVEVSGKVRMVGNSPMTFLVLSGETREWYIEEKEQKKLMELQQQFVTVKADEYYQDMVFANGSSAGRYYFLKNITVISPKKR